MQAELIVLKTIGILLTLIFAGRLIQRLRTRTGSKEELVQLQTQTLKAFFEVEELDREGSLLRYFHRRVQSDIAKPYRQGILTIIKYEMSADPMLFDVDETITYTCKKVGESI